MGRFVVHKSISIKAAPMKVWESLTKPEKTKKYFFHSEVYSDWKVGSAITFKGKMFLIIPFEMKGKIEQIEPGKLLQYTLKNGKDNDPSSGISTVTDVLTYQNGETTVSVTDDVGEGENAERRYNRSVKGWEKVLAGLKKTVEEDHG
jgi:uncharacterized protein YndB with AHSA1/START domain